MTWLSINPDSEPDNRLVLAGQIQGKFFRELKPEELASAYNLIEQMGCVIPPPDARTGILPDSYESDD